MNPNTCPECGGRPGDRTCQEIFDEFLALEFTDPGYGAVHFLTVACFMIQHGRYSDAGLEWIRPQLLDVLAGRKSIVEVRDTASQDADSGRRKWKIVRTSEDPPAPPVAWSMTIADVYPQAGEAAGYRAAITRWAETVASEMPAG